MIKEIYTSRDALNSEHFTAHAFKPRKTTEGVGGGGGGKLTILYLLTFLSTLVGFWRHGR